MSFFGFRSKKEVAELEAKAKEAGIQQGKTAGFNQGKEAIINQQNASLANFAKGSQVNFAVPYFEVFDPRFENFAVPVAVHGMAVFAVDDIDKFKSINKTESLSDEVFVQKLKGQITKYVKSVVTNAPVDNGIQVLQLERKILEISELVQRLVSPKIEQLFAINIRSLDITQINIDKASQGYRELKSVTADFERENLMARQQVNLSNFNLQNELNQDALKREHEMNLGGREEMQQMQLENQRETMRIQREEMQRAARLRTESNFLSAHQANLNADVTKTGSIFGQNNTNQWPQAPQMPSAFGTIPPMPGATPQVQYMVALNNQQVGPCNWNQLQQMVQQGQLTHQTYVWKQGMANWELAGQVQELQKLFMNTAPQMPGN